MSGGREIRVPDLGTDEKVDVVEVLVAPGEEVAIDDGLVTLESDKATMDVPSPEAGVVQKVLVKVGDRVGEGDLILTLEAAEEAAPPAPPPEPERQEAAAEAPDAPQEPAPAAAGEAREPEPGAADEKPPAAAPARVSVEAAGRAAAEGPADLETEILVLGAGPGGYTAAFRAADLGRRVVLVERYSRLGGVCLNVGCIPSKALLHVAKVIDEAADLEESGVAFDEPRFDLPRMRLWKDRVVGRLTSGLQQMADQRGVAVLQGAGHFTSPHRMEVVTADGSQSVAFERAIIAAGSRPVHLPGIPWDDDRVLDSTDALEIPEIPERLLIVGGGIIGLEMATVFGALGSRLTIVELLDGLMPGCDRDLVRPLERRLRRRYGAEIFLETRVEEIEPDPGGLVARLAGAGAPETAGFDRVLVSVGRRSNADRLNLEAAGVEVDEAGYVPVDARLATNVPHIHAIGDVTGPPLLAHRASHQGKVAAEAAAGEKSAFDARAVPSVAYTDPEIAWVGLTETGAAESDTRFEKAVFPWAASGRALGIGRSEGFTKLLFDPETRRLLGGGIVGPGAGDLVAELALAIEMDCEAADLALTVHPHPTLSETIGFAAEVFEGTITDLYLKKKA